MQINVSFENLTEMREFAAMINGSFRQPEEDSCR